MQVVCPNCNQKIEDSLFCPKCKSITTSKKEIALFYLGFLSLLNFGSVLASFLLPISSVVALFFFSWTRKNRRYLKISRITFFLSLVPSTSFFAYLLIFILPGFHSQFSSFSKYASDNLLYALFCAPFFCAIIISAIFYVVWGKK